MPVSIAAFGADDCSHHHRAARQKRRCRLLQGKHGPRPISPHGLGVQRCRIRCHVCNTLRQKCIFSVVQVGKGQQRTARGCIDGDFSICAAERMRQFVSPEFWFQGNDYRNGGKPAPCGGAGKNGCGRRRNSASGGQGYPVELDSNGGDKGIIPHQTLQPVGKLVFVPGGNGGAFHRV